MDLLRAFGTINHELLIAKVQAYGVIGKHPLETNLSCVSNHFQHVKINATFSSWNELIQVVRQRSVFGPILFNIYLNDLFFLY